MRINFDQVQNLKNMVHELSKLPEDESIRDLFKSLERDLSSALSDSPPPMDAVERRLVFRNNVVQAVKHYRDRTGLSLRICKCDVIDKFRETLPEDHPANPLHFTM